MKVKLIREIKFTAGEQTLIEKALYCGLTEKEKEEAKKLADEINKLTVKAAQDWGSF